MNIDSPTLNSLFASSENSNTSLPSVGMDGELSQSFADELKEQIQQLTKMKEIAAEQTHEGEEAGLSTFFGNDLPFFNSLEQDVDLENTIEKLENILSSLENVTTDEMNLEDRLQQLIEKTEVLKAETFESVELEEKVTRLAEELQKLVVQHQEQGSNAFGLTDNAGFLETQIEQISKKLGTSQETEVLNTAEADQLERLEQAELLVDEEIQLLAVMAEPGKVINQEQGIGLSSLSIVKQDIKKEELAFRQIVEQSVLEQSEETETDSLLQQENSFRRPGQDLSVMFSKDSETSKVLEDIDLSSNNEKLIPKFVSDIALLNKTTINTNKEMLSPMNKHFAHPEWNKEMGERILWMHKQAIPAAELKLNPRHLGPITIRIDVSQDQATVAFTAQHAVVKEALEAAIPKLKEMFSAQQLNLAEVNVSQGDTGQRQQKEAALMNNGQGNNRSSEAEFLADNEAEINGMDITEEIEAGRAIASNGLLSIFA